MDNHLFVVLAFVGNNLQNAVSYMDASTRNSSMSYLVLHYHPSVLTIRYNLVPVLFPKCQDPLLKRDSKDHPCMYSANKLTKVVWKQIENGAVELQEFLERFIFTYKDYENLLKFHKTELEMDSSVTMKEIACKWLKHQVRQQSGNTKEWYTQWNGHIRGRKKKLYIGGIFPISGTKYVAPELAIGTLSFQLKKTWLIKDNYSCENGC